MTQGAHSDSPSKRYFTPLRYPGGKSKLASFVKMLLVENDLVGGHYVEPFAGSASIALSLLFDGCVAHVHVNDLDPGVYAFWHSVLNDTEGLCRLIRNRRVSVAEWHRQREIYRSAKSAESLLARGFSTFFLNRTNRSGIIGSAGMIGGARQHGEWKLDARFNKVELVRRIERIAGYRQQISLYGLDAHKLLGQLMPQVPAKTFIYLDPPYYVKGKRRLYANFYEHEDHAKLAGALAALKVAWIVSYDDALEIRRLYGRFRASTYLLDYTARDRYPGAEIMFFSDRLSIPRPATARGNSEARASMTKVKQGSTKKGLSRGGRQWVMQGN